MNSLMSTPCFALKSLDAANRHDTNRYATASHDAARSDALTNRFIMPIMIAILLTILPAEVLLADSNSNQGASVNEADVNEVSVNQANESSSEASTTKKKPKKIRRIPKRLANTELVREKMTLGIGGFYSTGEYGTDKSTDIFSIPLRASYSRNNWRVSAQMPLLHITGPASVIAISDGAEVIDKIAEGEKERWGNGDLRLSAQHTSFSFDDPRAGISLGASVKLPIATNKSDLSSGEIDLSLYSSGYLQAGAWVTNGRVGYQFMGDTPETNYDNRWFASLGGYYRLTKQYSAGVNMHYKQPALETSDPVHTFSSYLNSRLSNGWRASLSIGFGLSEASADYFTGVQFTKSFVRKSRASIPAN